MEPKGNAERERDEAMGEDWFPECAKCHVGMYLVDGHEWPDDKSEVLCSSCSIDELAKLRAEVERLTREVDHWRRARQNALDGGEILKAKLAEAEADNATLRTDLAAAHADLAALTDVVEKGADLRETTARLRAKYGVPAPSRDAALRAEVERLRGTGLCVYCGHVGPKEPDEIGAHVLSCEKRPEAKLLDLIEALLPYAESRAEDLSDLADEIEAAGGATDLPRACADKAWAAVRDARVLFGPADRIVDLITEAIR